MTGIETIEFCFTHYDSIKQAISEKRLAPSGGAVTGGNGSGHSRVSDPTAIKALRNITALDKVVVYYGAKVNGSQACESIKTPELWLAVVDNTKGVFAHKRHLEVIRRKYNESEKWNMTCKAMNISKGKYYALLNDVIRQAELYAVAYGLLAPYHR